MAMFRRFRRARGRRRPKVATHSRSGYGRRSFRVGLKFLPKGGFTIKRKGIPALVQCTAAGTIEAINTAGSASTSLILGEPVFSYESTSLTRTYDVPFSMKFALEELFAYTDITSISDRYRIAHVQIKIHGYNNFQINGALNYAPNQFIEYVTDYDDATAPTLQSFSEKMGTRTKGFNQQGMITLSCRPRIPMMTGESHVSIPSRSVFIDSASPEQEHYAIKGVFRNLSLYDTKSLGLKVQYIYTVIVRDLQ